jgi:hypothetical protein
MSTREMALRAIKSFVSKTTNYIRDIGELP